MVFLGIYMYRSGENKKNIRSKNAYVKNNKKIHKIIININARKYQVQLTQTHTIAEHFDSPVRMK